MSGKQMNVITQSEKSQIVTAAMESNSCEDAITEVTTVLVSQGWCWRRGEWGYSDEHWTTLVRNGSRAAVTSTGNMTAVKIEIRDLTGDSLEDLMKVDLTHLEIEDDLDEVEFCELDEFI